MGDRRCRGLLQVAMATSLLEEAPPAQVPTAGDAAETGQWAGFQSQYDAVVTASQCTGAAAVDDC